MHYSLTTTTEKIKKLSKRIRAVQGGTSASKTISILIYLIALAQSDKTATLTSIVSESFPHLRRGVMRDFLNILETHNYFKRDRWDKTNSIYTFETGSQIEFFSADQPSKARGPRRERLFINEANNVPYETFDQLEVRTSDFIFLDWNPATEFWYYNKVANRDDVEHIIVTYKDNEALDPAIVKSIEQRQSNPSWWKVYGQGQLGEIETSIYRSWDIIDQIPNEARLIKYGLDFGYTNDPTAIVAIYYHNGGYIFDEIAYQKGLSNKQIVDIIKTQPEALVIADSAEPKSIDEISQYGINISRAVKGPGSVLRGIQFVQSVKCSVTKRSVNIIKEYRNYIWITDKDGKVLNEPDHLYSHSMDAIRYPMSTISPKEDDTARTIFDDFRENLRLDPRTGYPL
jgi:phage terminase large subunit